MAHGVASSPRLLGSGRDAIGANGAEGRRLIDCRASRPTPICSADRPLLEVVAGDGPLARSSAWKCPPLPTRDEPSRLASFVVVNSGVSERA